MNTFSTLSPIILAISLLSACATTSTTVQAPFPEPPEKLMEKPKDLLTIKGDAPTVTEAMLKDTSPSNVQLTTVVTVISKNMGICNGYREQIIELQSWITDQKNASVPEIPSKN